MSEDFRKGSDRRRALIEECCLRMKEKKDLLPKDLKNIKDFPSLLEELGYDEHIEIVRLQMWFSSGYFYTLENQQQQQPPPGDSNTVRQEAARRVQKAGAICTNFDAMFRTIRLIKNDTRLSASLSEDDFRSLFQEVLPNVPLCRSIDGSFNLIMSKVFGDIICKACTVRNSKDSEKCNTCATPLDNPNKRQADVCPVCSIEFLETATQEEKHTHVNLHFAG